MSYEIKADYDTQYLFPPSLEEWIPEDHPARFIREFVDMLDMEELGFRIRESCDGRPNYASSLLLKVWLYGYLEGIRSSRKLEKACMNHFALVWLTGNNAPDHNTLWRFFNDNEDAIRRLFKETVRVALNADLIGLALHAVDGTKIKARSSFDGVVKRWEVDELLERLDGYADEAAMEIERSEEAERGEYRLPGELRSREKLRERLMRARERMDEAKRNLINPDEGEARIMRCSGKLDLAYNAQIVVDEKRGMIVAEDVTNEENDVHQLASMIGMVEDNAGGAADETLADGGYYASEELSKAEERGYSVLVNIPSDGNGEFHWSRFAYDEKNDCLTCPMGKKLELSYVDRHDDSPSMVYSCRSYKDCPRRFDCSADKRQGRRVRTTFRHKVVMRQKKKQDDSTNRSLLARRKAIVERPFAIIKECMGLRRWTYNGLSKVRVQWSIICSVFNLKHMYKHWLENKFILKPV